MKWILRALINFANFKGRACRREYWWFQLFVVLVAFVPPGILVMLGAISDGNALDFSLSIVNGVLLFLPMWTVTVRRLQDINRSGRWFLLAGYWTFLIFMVWMCRAGSKRRNNDGNVPCSCCGSEVEEDNASVCINCNAYLIAKSSDNTSIEQNDNIATKFLVLLLVLVIPISYPLISGISALLDVKKYPEKYGLSRVWFGIIMIIMGTLFSAVYLLVILALLSEQ